MSGNFGDLLKQAGFQASPESHATAKKEPSEAPVAGPRYGAKVVVRRTKAGRGGKTVTLVQGVVDGHKKVAKALRKKLGTGARVEGDDIAVQGDQRDRIADWLEEQGVTKVVRS